jgi:Uncharacterized bacitracin resistance protein
MPEWIAVVLLGIIEGITEFIPVSSTGHLLLAERWLPHKSDLFNVVIQCGAVVAVLPLFPERLRQFAVGWREKATQDYLLKIFVAFAITGAVGLVLEKMDFQLDNEPVPIAVALVVGGILFLAIERWLKGKPLRNEITWPVVIAVGCAQLLAMIFPGTSRSGSTILFALLLGLNRPLATEFSFLVGIPTMLCAGGVKILKALNTPAGEVSENWGMVLLGTLVSAAVSFAAVRWLLRYVQTHTFVLFGWYRIVVGAALLVLFLS